MGAKRLRIVPGRYIRLSWGLLALWLCAGACSAEAPSQPAPENGTWTEVDKARLDLDAVTERGRQILELPGIDWKHAQTRHFVIHYEQAIFARKVARMAEFFYSYIAQDLQGAQDHVNGRSHIFIFRSEKRWREFLQTMGDVPDWIFSQVSGTVMFLQQAENTSSSGDVLAHETTHLVVNRFFKKRCPLWLNEGLAEYYGEFAYSAYKGVKKSKRAQFGRLANPFPLDELFSLRAYPQEDAAVRSFYATAKYAVAFLLLEFPPADFLPFVEDLMNDVAPEKALLKNYRLKSMDDFRKRFNRFAS